MQSNNSSGVITALPNIKSIKTMRIGIRLKALLAMINKPYTHIWDCCCDHGLLGFQLLDSTSCENVHFVDIVPELINEVDQHLKQHYLDKSGHNRWQTHSLDARKIPLQNIDKQLIIIAGVGGDLLIEFVESIVQQYPSLDLEFLLCPVHHNYKVRRALSSHNLGLVNEKIICENKRYYEIIHVASHEKTAITPTGTSMWDKTDPVHKAYLKKTLNHYQRMLHSQHPQTKKEAQDSLSAYAPLKSLFNM